MDRTSTLSAAEIVGVAAASAAALGGVIVALGRSQATSTKDRFESVDVAATQKMAKENVDKGRELAKSAATTLAASYPDIRDGAADLLHRAAESARPHVQRAAESARPHASKMGTSASTTAEQVKATGATVLERIHDDVLPAASVAISGLVERAGEARERSGPSADGVKAAAAAKADVALTKSTSAAKDTLATVAWTAAALSLIYWILLNPERREQLKSFIWSAVDQTLVLVRDFQGYEEEF